MMNDDEIKRVKKVDIILHKTNLTRDWKLHDTGRLKTKQKEEGVLSQLTSSPQQTVVTYS